MFQKLRQIYENVQETLVEGNYRAEPGSGWSRLFGKKQDELPETTEIAVGATMIGTSRTWGARLMFGSAVALLSMHFMAWTALAIGVIGATVLGVEYVQCRKARNDVITEVNFASQKVQGTRADLCRLHMAQVRIMNLANAFRPASAETTHETVQDIIDSVAKESKRVKVLDAGRYDADAAAYDFSEPGIKLVNDKNNPAHATRAAASSVSSLKTAFDGTRYTEDEVIEHLAHLEQSLPPQMQEKLKQRLARPAA